MISALPLLIAACCIYFNHPVFVRNTLWHVSIPRPAPAENAVVKKIRHESTFVRVSRYVVVRLLTLFVTVVIGIYLTIMIANMGGFVDQIMKGEIRDRVTQSIISSPLA